MIPIQNAYWNVIFNLVRSLIACTETTQHTSASENCVENQSYHKLQG